MHTRFAISMLIAVCSLAACAVDSSHDPERLGAPSMALVSDTSVTLFETEDPAWAPSGVADLDTQPVELGVKFVPFVPGTVTAIQFFRPVSSASDYTVHLWTEQGVLLATGTVQPSSTPGWQTATFPAPVDLQPLQTYVASYYTSTGGYAFDQGYFDTSLTRGPLIALGATGGEVAPKPGGGVYRYGAGGGFPTATYLSSNYWVSPVFEPSPSVGAAPVVTGLTPISPTVLQIDGSNFTPDAIGPSVWFGATRGHLSVYSPTQIEVNIPAHAPGSVHVRVLTSAGESATTAADLFTYGDGVPAGLTVTANDDASTLTQWDAVGGASSYRLYRGTTPGGATLVASPASNFWNDTNGESGLTRCQRYYYQVAAVTGGSEGPRSAEVSVFVPCISGTTYSVFSPSVTPENPVEADFAPVELGVRFTSAVAGTVKAIRFYRGVAIPSGYTVHLWDASGALLTSGVAIEGQGPAPGWQEVAVSPTAIEANEVYTASYFASSGEYAGDLHAFDVGFVNGPLTLLGDGNGVYAYGSTSAFPALTYENSNYFVDVVFEVE